MNYKDSNITPKLGDIVIYKGVNSVLCVVVNLLGNDGILTCRTYKKYKMNSRSGFALKKFVNHLKFVRRKTQTIEQVDMFLEVFDG